MRQILPFAMLALSATAATTPALAQSYGAPAAAPQPIAIPAGPAATGPLPICQAGISKGARPALISLQTAVVAKTSAVIPGLVASAQAVAKSPADKCFIAQMQMKASVDANDLRGVASAIAAQQATGLIPAATIANLYEGVGTLQYKAGAFSEAGTSFERALQIAPTRGSLVVMLAETRTKQGRIPDALPLYQKAIAIETAAGRKPAEDWYKRPVAVAYGAKSPLTYGLARDWVSAYPSAKNWREAILLYGQMSGADDATMIDLYRLQRIKRALVGNGDYARYAQFAIDRGLSGEAKGVLEEGFAANAIDRNHAMIKALYTQAAAKSAGDRASLAGQAQIALSGAQSKPVMVLGEAYFGYGDYAKAAELFRSARGKAGVDAELANLRLGMAMAAAGDQAGANTALRLVTGQRAEIARYWLTYAATR